MGSKGVRRVSKKAKRTCGIAKTGPVWHLSAEEAALAKKPRYNGYACGHGAHGDAKYNRAKMKRTWKHSMEREGTLRGSFPFFDSRLEAFLKRFGGDPGMEYTGHPLAVMGVN